MEPQIDGKENKIDLNFLDDNRKEAAPLDPKEPKANDQPKNEGYLAKIAPILTVGYASHQIL